MEIKLGQKVRDKLTGFEGTAVCRTVWLHGCVRIGIQPFGTDEKGSPKDCHSFDEPQVEVLEPEAPPIAKPRHGPKPEAGRKRDVR